MKKIFLFVSAIVFAQTTFASEIVDKIKNAGENEIVACKTAEDNSPIYVFSGGDIYMSKSGNSNPKEVVDYELFGKVESLIANEGTFFDFSIGEKVYSADFVDKVVGKEIYFIQSIEDNGGQITSGTLLNEGKESNLSCADVTLYK